MVDVETLRRANGIESMHFDEINRDVAESIQPDSIDTGQVNDLMREIAADQAPEASEALERVAADGGIEAHAMKGDPSKCPFLMGKIGVGQHVEIGEIPTAPQGRSVKEIREERRRLRAQAKEVQTEPAVPARIKDVVTQAKVSDFQPRLEHVIRQAHVEALPAPQPFERKKGRITDTPASSQKHPAVKSAARVVHKGAVKGGINERSDSPKVTQTESKDPRITVDPAVRQPSAENKGARLIVEVSPVQLVQEKKRTFNRSIDDISRTVDVPKKVPSITKELLVPDPGLSIELSGHTPAPKEVVVNSIQNAPRNLDFDRGVTAALTSPEAQDHPKEPVSLQELMVPYVADDAAEKTAVLEIVQVLNEKIRNLVDSNSLISSEAEITKTIEQLVQKFPEQLRTELRMIVSARVQEMIAEMEIYSDQRETFNILGTHEFKFFHHKPQAQLQIKEKAGRYLLTLLTKDYALA